MEQVTQEQLEQAKEKLQQMVREFGCRKQADPPPGTKLYRVVSEATCELEQHIRASSPEEARRIWDESCDSTLIEDTIDNERCLRIEVLGE